MGLDKFTVKLQEALQEAISLATEYGHQQVEPEHLFYACLKQEDSIIASVLDKLNLPAFSLVKIIEENLHRKPSVSGGDAQVYLSGRLNKLFHNAQKEALALRDEFISAEHILLAYLSDAD